MNKATVRSKPSTSLTLVRSSVVNGCLTIQISGRFDFNCHRDFRVAYEGHAPMNEYVVDLKDADYLDSSALGMLLVLREEREPARVRVVNCRPAVRRILEIASFQDLFSLE